jgi:hypothetical protein
LFPGSKRSISFVKSTETHYNCNDDPQFSYYWAKNSAEFDTKKVSMQLNSKTFKIDISVHSTAQPFLGNEVYEWKTRSILPNRATAFTSKTPQIKVIAHVSYKVTASTAVQQNFLINSGA